LRPFRSFGSDLVRESRDFLTAYFDFARDEFCPDDFHYWTGVSVVAGALERKVWLNQSGRFTYPNLYVFLVAKPGEGKTTASDLGIDFLKELQDSGGRPGVSILPAKMSDAFFEQKMAHSNKFTYQGEEHIHCSHFFYVSEAENSLKEMTGGGELTAALTEFYDCPKNWKRGTKKDGETSAINVCCNALVGITYSCLSRVVLPDQKIMGGFASRILYVAHSRKKVRNVKWEVASRRTDLRIKLQSDLQHIHNLKGQFSVSREFGQAFEDWFPLNDQERADMKSERLQSLAARRQTNILKLAMVCSVSESDDLRLEKDHWDRALELLQSVEKNMPDIFEAAANVSNQSGAYLIALRSAQREGGVGRSALLNSLISRGLEMEKASQTLEALIATGKLLLMGNGKYEAIGDLDEYL
jgi:hypothetical protein